MIDDSEDDEEILELDEQEIKNPKDETKKELTTEEDDDDDGKSETKKDNSKIQQNYVKKEGEPWLQTWLKNNYYKIYDKGSSGDCFFLSVAAAYNSINIDLDVKKQRTMLSENTTNDQVNNYNSLYKSTLNEISK